MDAKFVSDFRPINLIGSVYKVVTKILANRLATVISDLVSNTQSAFVANRQILDGPFILNEAYDSVRWDFLLDVLLAFGFGPKWCQWIRGIFSSNMASILVNGSPTSEVPIFCGLKQGDPLAPFLFILVMESFHLSVSRAVNDGIFKGLHITGSKSLSHLFYVDDAVFIGEWSSENLDNLLIKELRKVRARLSKWKVNTLSIGGRWTLLKSVLEISVAAKWGAPSFDDSFRRQVRDEVERNQWYELLSLLGTISLSPSSDRYFCDLNGDGVFRVKDIRSALDKLFLPSSDVATRWVKFVPIKVNIFAWRASLDRLPTRGNLIFRGVTMDSLLCPICELTLEDSSHIFFSCDLGKSISQRIYRWWNIQ
nr:RNA-directed DNA polymerase, eukaryota [Tanacetum cinerariifolium]